MSNTLLTKKNIFTQGKLSLANLVCITILFSGYNKLKDERDVVNVGTGVLDWQTLFASLG